MTSASNATECCENCKFSKRTSFGGVYCMRHAPIIATLKVTTGESGNYNHSPSWPVVGEGYWCGDYQSRG